MGNKIVLRCIAALLALLIPIAAHAQLYSGGASLPVGPPIVNGWTVFTDTDGTAVYVSFSTGSNANNGLSSGAPKQTLAAAVTVLNALTNNRPHRLYLKAGDTWTGETIGQIKVSGRSASEPLLITAYGVGARPKIKTPVSPSSSIAATGSGGGSAGGNYVAVVGIEMVSYTRDPNDAAYVGPQDSAGQAYVGISWLNATNWLLVEDCKFSYFTTSISLEGSSGQYPVIRRNVIVDQYAGNVGSFPHSQGVFLQYTNAALFEENVFDHNGWLTTVDGVFNHNIYHDAHGNGILPYTAPITVVGNIFANDSSGSQFRAGGQISNNTFINSPYGHNLGFPGGIKLSLVTDNVHTGQLTYPNSGAVSSIDTFTTYQGGFYNVAQVSIARNIFTTQGNATTPAITIDAGQSNNSLTYNIVYKWTSGIVDNGTNDTVANNLIDLTGTNPFGWPDPSRTVATYDASLGGPGTVANFLTEARQQSKANWRTAYTGPATNNYFRAGFGITP